MASDGRMFPTYRRWVMPALALAAGLLTLVTGLVLLGVGRMLGLALLPAVMVVLADRLVLCGNGWLRRRVAERLRQLGEQVDTGRDRFVGLAHPCHLQTWSRRVIETDDDVGFLEVTPEGLTYHGDGLEFSVAREQFVGVRRVQSWFAPWRRVELEIADGEPFDTVIFDSRQFASHAQCRVDNQRLYESLATLCERPPQRARLSTEELELALDGLAA